MASAMWSVLCGRALVDAVTGSVSLIDIAEEVLVVGAPHDQVVPLPLQMVLATFWWRSKPDQAERGKTRFHVRSPTGESLATSRELDVDLESNGRKHTVATIERMPVRGPGRYRFIVEYRTEPGQWSACAEVAFEVRVDAATEGDPG